MARHIEVGSVGFDHWRPVFRGCASCCCGLVPVW